MNENKLVVSHELTIQSNMDELAARIQNNIKEKYDVVVSEDTVADSKKLMAQINKDKDEFSNTYRAFKEKVLEPLKPLDEKAKQIVGYFEAARAAVDSQVKKFEASKLALAKEVCTAYRKEVCEAKGISVEAINIDNLCNQLGSVTASGKISGSAKDKIGSMVQAVENEMLKAKIEAEEKAKRDREIAEQAKKEAELKAEKDKAELEARLRREHEAEIERVKQVAAQPAQPQAVAKENLTPQHDQLGQALGVQPEEVQKRDDGKRVYYVTARFEVLAPDNIDKGKISDKLKGLIESAGIASLKSIEVR